MKKRGKIRGKRALSPVIATVLLVAMVIILATIIFLWARGFIKEIVEKEIAGVKKTAEKFCPDVNFEASVSVSDNLVSIVNRGNVPIYKINIKKKIKGSSDIEQGEVLNIGIGQSKTVPVTNPGDYDEINIIPVLLGESDEEQKESPCPEKYGVECIKEEGGSFIC